MSIDKASMGPRVKWDGMRRWNLSRVTVVDPALSGMDPTASRPMDAQKLQLPLPDPGVSVTASAPISEVSGQGSGEGGRDGLRRPAPWSLAQGSGGMLAEGGGQPQPMQSFIARKSERGGKL